jgi:hypothetical protein
MEDVGIDQLIAEVESSYKDRVADNVLSVQDRYN